MDEKSIWLLKNEVQEIFGRRIQSSSDCQNLCNDILRVNSVKISFNTIRRLFNLMKADSKPSKYTVNVLSNYCGFSSFDHFITTKQSAITGPQEQNEVLLSFLTLFFKQIEVCKGNDVTFLKLVELTILHLQHHPSIIDRFVREIAKTRNGQNFYFEQFIFIDKLNSYHGKGLLHYLNEKKTQEAQIFGHSLLCYQSWLRKHNEGIEMHYKIVMGYKVNLSISSSVCARYFATQLYYADKFYLDQENIKLGARKFYYSMMQLKENASSLNCFEIILCEALILVGQCDEALFYIEEILKEVKRNVPSYIDVALYETICLFKAIVFARRGKKMKAGEILQDINPGKFSFLCKKYLNILYLSIRQVLKSKSEDQEEIQHLIQETGFIALSSIWQDSPVPSRKAMGKVGQKIIGV